MMLRNVVLNNSILQVPPKTWLVTEVPVGERGSGMLRITGEGGSFSGWAGVTSTTSSMINSISSFIIVPYESRGSYVKVTKMPGF